MTAGETESYSASKSIQIEIPLPIAYPDSSSRNTLYTGSMYASNRPTTRQDFRGRAGHENVIKEVRIYTPGV